jgi:hypothetical protein
MTRYALLALLAVAAGGCSDRGYRVAPVSGRVTVNGRPAVKYHVEFLPDGGGKVLNPGPGAVGVTDAQGVFVLNCPQTREKGAVVGRNRVVLTASSPPGVNPDAETEIPNRSAMARQDALTIRRFTYEVPAGGTDKADFEWNSKK